MLADGTGDSTRSRGYARRIADEAERLGRVVVNVLGFSQLQRGGLSVRPEPGDLAETVRDSVSRLSTDLETRGATLELSVVGPLEPALFDADALHQILQNLVDNAEKYSRAATNRTIEILLAPGPVGPTLSVVDHGDGIEPSIRRRLFKPFARHPDPSAPAGLGIGLALVRALAREQSASITHSEVDGGGTCFTVTFRSTGKPVPA
jgi:signal transduction histidine kinase